MKRWKWMVEEIWPQARSVIDYTKIASDDYINGTRTIADGLIRHDDFVMYELTGTKKKSKMDLRYLGPLKVKKEDGKDHKFILLDKNGIVMVEAPMNKLKKVKIMDETVLWDSTDPKSLDDLLALHSEKEELESHGDLDYVDENPNQKKEKDVDLLDYGKKRKRKSKKKPKKIAKKKERE